MGDDVSGDDADDDDDDDEAEPLDEGDDLTALAALSLAASESAAVSSPIAITDSVSPLRDRRTSSGSGRLASRASLASGSSRASSPAVALEDEDGDEVGKSDSGGSEVEALSDGEGEVKQQVQEDAVSAPEETWRFVGISRRSLSDLQNQTK
jgi:hypothetical protein